MTKLSKKIQTQGCKSTNFAYGRMQKVKAANSREQKYRAAYGRVQKVKPANSRFDLLHPSICKVCTFAPFIESVDSISRDGPDTPYI